MFQVQTFGRMQDVQFHLCLSITICLLLWKCLFIFLPAVLFLTDNSNALAVWCTACMLFWSMYLFYYLQYIVQKSQRWVWW